ncbi:hypothetical protein EJ110_NYTH58590 [Nymphaea thermarum]|nr:hypothetical protein EJ110_NYTH58590 [Nymphaea thermarum]
MTQSNGRWVDRHQEQNIGKLPCILPLCLILLRLLMLLCEILDKVIQEVGPENFVQFMIDNAANYKAAGYS